MTGPSAGERQIKGQLGKTPISPTVVALIAANVVVYLVSRFNPASAYERFAMIPILVHSGEWYRLVTAAFLHASGQHILFNMVTLLVIGSPVEALVGRVRFGAIFILGGVGGSVCSYLLSRPTIEGIGASGAIFGLFGGYAVLARRHRFDTRVVGALIFIELLTSVLNPAVDWRAHIGGLVVGAVVTRGFLVSAGGHRAAVASMTVVVTVALLAALTALPPGQVNL